MLLRITSDVTNYTKVVQCLPTQIKLEYYILYAELRLVL